MRPDTGALLLAAAAAFSVSGLLTLALAHRPQLLARLIDAPNERSLHAAPIPRTGGIAVLAGLLATALPGLALLAPASDWAWIGAAATLVAAVSYLDDRGEVAPQYRLGAHAAAALLLAAGGLAWDELQLPGMSWALPGWLAVVATLLYVVWMVNLYNFMDGMDGFAGGMAVFGFAALAWLGWAGDDPGFALAAVTAAAAAAGFLLGNFPPARIFLGDLGSTGLGLLAAALSLLGAGRGLFPLWVAWLAFSPFIVDATWTLLARLVRGERVWQAHRSHHYQRLVLAGWSHRRTLLRSYLLMAACALTAAAAVGLQPADQWRLLGAWAVIYALIGWRVRLVERLAGRLSP